MCTLFKKYYNILIGRGVRTTINRAQGDFLLIYSGDLISGEEGRKKEEQDDSVFRYFFRFKSKEWWYVYFQFWPNSRYCYQGLFQIIFAFSQL